jgi:hypothetical protein
MNRWAIFELHLRGLTCGVLREAMFEFSTAFQGREKSRI